MALIPEDIKQIDRRIKKVKEKKGNKKKQPDDFAKVSVGIQLGIEFLSGTFVGAAIGYMLDEVFDMKFLLLLIFTVLGSFAGVLNAYRYAEKLNIEENKEGK